MFFIKIFFNCINYINQIYIDFINDSKKQEQNNIILKKCNISYGQYYCIKQLVNGDECDDDVDEKTLRHVEYIHQLGIKINNENSWPFIIKLIKNNKINKVVPV